MCVDPNLSRRRQRRLDRNKKGKTKLHRPWSRIFFVKGRTDTRSQRLERLHQMDALVEVFADLVPQAEPFTSEMIAVEDLEASQWLRQREDAEAAKAWFENHPNAAANIAA